MKKLMIPTLSIVLVIILSACGVQQPSVTEAPDVEATVNAAVEATVVAEIVIQATIDAAVQATADAAPEPTQAPTPVTTDYEQVSEEELAEMIDQAVNAAIADSQQASEATQEVTSDGTVTQEEINYVYEYYYGMDEAIALAYELLDSYYYYYGDLAYAYLDLFYAVEEDLSALVVYAAELDAALQDVYTALETGVALADANLAQLETTSQNIQATVLETQSHIVGVVDTVTAQIEDRQNAIMSIQPDNIPTGLPETLQFGFQYLDTVRDAIGDHQITRDELTSIAQLGANASAGFSQFGKPEHSQLPDMMQGSGGVTANLAGGNNFQAQNNLGNFESSLGDRPAPGGGDGPSIDVPDRDGPDVERPDVDRPDIDKPDRPGDGGGIRQ